MILWGVLNGLGGSMILTGLLQKYKKLDIKWFFIFLLAFIISYKIPRETLYNADFFKSLYDSNLFIIGFPSDEFRSSDYFPLIPWIFIYLAGFILGRYLVKKDFFAFYGKDNVLAKIGRYAMPIYLAHQVILYPLVTMLYKFIS